MHIGKSYKLLEFLDWTRRDAYILILLGIVPVIGYQIGDQKWLGIPWTVVALLGTATAFIVGFKNLQTYNRAWEARQIWGDILSGSRAWGIMSRDFLDDPEKSKELTYRHLAWLTAMRYQMRDAKPWESTSKGSQEIVVSQFVDMQRSVGKIVRSHIKGGSYEDANEVGFGSRSRGGGLFVGRGGGPE